MKQYGIDPRLVLWIQKNTGHDLQTFSDLAKIKCLDSRKRNFSAVKKIEDVRLPSWLVVKEDDFSLLGEMTKLKQLSLHDIAINDYSFLTRCRCLRTLDLQDTSFSDCRLLAEQVCQQKKLSVESPASCEPLCLGDTAHLSMDGMGIVLFLGEVMKSVISGSDFLAQ